MTIGISNKTIYSKAAEEYLRNAADTKKLIDEYEEKRKNTKCESLKRHYVHKLMALYMMYNECLYKARKLYTRAEKVNV